MCPKLFETTGYGVDDAGTMKDTACVQVPSDGDLRPRLPCSSFFAHRHRLPRLHCSLPLEQ